MSDDIESRRKEILSILGEAIPEEKPAEKIGVPFIPAEPSLENLKPVFFELEDDDLPAPPRLEDVFRNNVSVSKNQALNIDPKRLDTLKIVDFECWGIKFYLFKETDGTISIFQDQR
mgnify:CR=1 FL=1